MKPRIDYEGSDNSFPNRIEIIIIILLILDVIFLECWIIFIVNSLMVLFIVFLCLFVTLLITLIILIILRCNRNG